MLGRDPALSPREGWGDTGCERPRELVWVLGMLGLPVGFGSHREMFVEEGFSRDALGVSIPLLLLSPSHEDTGADFLAKGSALCTSAARSARTPGLLPAHHTSIPCIPACPRSLSLCYSLQREDFISDVCRAKPLALCFIPCDGFLSRGITQSPAWCRTAAPGSLQGLQKDTEKSPITP